MLCQGSGSERALVEIICVYHIVGHYVYKKIKDYHR